MSIAVEHASGTLPSPVVPATPSTRDRLAILDVQHRHAATEHINALSLEARVLDSLRGSLRGCSNHFNGRHNTTTWTDILAGVRRAFSLLDLCRIFTSRRTEARKASRAILDILAATQGCFVGDRGDEVAFRERSR